MAFIFLAKASCGDYELRVWGCDVHAPLSPLASESRRRGPLLQPRGACRRRRSAIRRDLLLFVTVIRAGSAIGFVWVAGCRGSYAHRGLEGSRHQ